MSSRACLIVLLSSLLQVTSGRGQPLRKVADDVLNMYTNVGKIGLTVTNLATIGDQNAFWPTQPSCVYPIGSGIEHIWQGGLWVGAKIVYAYPKDPRAQSGDIFVSTGSNDRAGAPTTYGGNEFTSEIGDSITELSSLENGRPAGALFSVNAVSHQDFICDYSDLHTRVPQTNDSILNHIPLGIHVHQESYAWNFPFADYFVILRYEIKNVSADTLDSVYVGFWNNSVVRNTNLVRPGTPGYFDHGAFGYDSTLRMAYSFDFDGIPGGPPANSYVGLKLLGTTPFPVGIDSLGDMHLKSFYNAWRYRAASGQTQEEYLSPTDDYNTSDHYLSRYGRMTQSMPQSAITPLQSSPGNFTYLLSTGPLVGAIFDSLEGHQETVSRLNPGDSLEVVFGIVCGKKYGNDPTSANTLDDRKTLYGNASWAQQAYNGEDANGNNKLDPGEDLNGNGKLDRYTLPAPPRKPLVRAEVANQQVVIYWDKATAEESIDPVSHKKDFEGYRVYRSVAGQDFLNHDDFLLNLPLVAEFDRADDEIGYNTGFGTILLDSAKTFPFDTTHYWYQFPPKGVAASALNGWQYIYGVSAFDSGDVANGVPSLESAKSTVRVIPGTPATSDNSKPIGVYPNPYYSKAYWDGGTERLRKIYFYNLPARCDITIYTLAGDVVTVLHHDASTYDGTDIKWFNQFGDPSTKAQFSGGEHAWDLITAHDQAIATGMYLFSVKDDATGSIKLGRFLVIK